MLIGGTAVPWPPRKNDISEDTPMKENEKARIDSTAWVTELDRQIREQGYVCDLPEFEQVPMDRSETMIPVEPFSADSLEEELACLHAGEEVQAFRPLPDTGVKLLVKRILRKLMKFYIEPITRDVTDFHRADVLAIAQLRNHAVEQAAVEKRVAELEQTVQELQRRIEQMEADKEARA